MIPAQEAWDQFGYLVLSCDAFVNNLLVTAYQMKSGLLLDVVVRQCSAIFQLLSSKDEPLLVRRNTLLVLNLRLHILN